MPKYSLFASRFVNLCTSLHIGLYGLGIAVVLLAGQVIAQPPSTLPSDAPKGESDQTEVAKQAGAAAMDRDEVLKIIQQLSNANLEVQNDAMKKLGAMGKQIEPILKERFNRVDLQARVHITAILKTIEMGLEFDTPADIRQLAETLYESDDPRQRSSAAQGLISKGYLGPVIAEIRQLHHSQERDLYIQSVINMRLNKRSENVDRQIFDLLAIAIKEPEKRIRTSLVSRVLNSQYVRDGINEAPFLERILTFVQSTKNREFGEQFISSVRLDWNRFKPKENAHLLAKLTNLAAEQLDPAKRRSFVSRLLPAQAVAWMTKRGRYYGASQPTGPFDLDRYFKLLSDGGKQLFVASVAESISSLHFLHQKIGDEALLRACRCDDPSTRGWLTGRLFGLSDWPLSEPEKRSALAIIKREPNALVKQKMISGFVSAIRRAEPNPKTESIADGIWTLLTSGDKTADDQPWQLVALADTFSAPNLFGKKYSVESIDKMLRLADTASASDVQHLVVAAYKQDLPNQLQKHSRTFAFLKTIARVLPSNARVTSLLGSTAFGKTFDTPKRRQELIDFVDRQDTFDLRALWIGGILGNQTLMGQMMDDGHYRTFERSLIAPPDGLELQDKKYADLLAKFVTSPVTVAFLEKHDRTSELLGFCQPKYSALCESTVLLRQLASDVTLDAIYKNGDFAKFTAKIDSQQDPSERARLQQMLVKRRAYTMDLAKRKQLTAKFRSLDGTEKWFVTGAYRDLVRNLTSKDLRNDPSAAMEAWKLCKRMDKRNRTEFLDALVQSKWFLPSLDEQKQLEPILKELVTDLTPARVAMSVRQVVSSKNIVTYFENGQLNALLRLCSVLDRPNESNAFRAIGRSSYVKKWLEQKDQLSPLLKTIHSITDEKQRARFAFQFFSSGPFFRGKPGSDVAQKLAKITMKQPEPTRTMLAVALLSNEATAKEIVKENLSDVFRGQLTKVFEEFATDTLINRSSYYRNIIQNLRLAHLKNEPDLGGNLWRRVGEGKTVEEKRNVVTTLLSSPWFLMHLTETKKLDAVLKDAAKIIEPTKWKSIASSISRSDGLLEMLDPKNVESLTTFMLSLEPSDRQYLLQSAVANSSVTQWFQSPEQPEQLFKVLDAIENEEAKSSIALPLVKKIVQVSRIAQGTSRGDLFGGQSEQRGNPKVAPKLVAYAKKQSADLRSKIFLAICTSADETLLRQPDVIDFLIQQLDRPQLSPVILQEMLMTSRFGSILKERKASRKLIRQIFEIKDPSTRSQIQARLLTHYYFFDELSDQEIREIMTTSQDVLTSTNLSKLFRLQQAVPKLIDLGYYEKLHQTAVDHAKTDTTQNLRWLFYTHPSIVEKERKAQRKADVIAELLGVTSRYSRSRLSELSHKPEALGWLLETRGWTPINDVIRKVSQRDRSSIMQSLLFSSASARQILKHGLLDEVMQSDWLAQQHARGPSMLIRLATLPEAIESAELMKQVKISVDNEKPKSYPYTRSVLQHPQFHSFVIKHGQQEWFLETLRKRELNPASTDTPEAQVKVQPKVQPRSFNSSDNIYAFAIKTGQHDVAEKMLADNATNDVGKLRLIRFGLIREQFGSDQYKINESKHIQRFVKDPRFAYYLARAKAPLNPDTQTQGELDALADATKDPVLVWSNAIESHNWKQAAAMDVCKTKMLPASWVKEDINPIHRRIEQLSFSSFLHRLNGDAKADNDQKELVDWMGQYESNFPAVRYGTGAFLLTDEIDDAVSRLDSLLPRRAFYLHRDRMDYDRGLEVIGWNPKHSLAIFNSILGKDPLKLDAPANDDPFKNPNLVATGFSYMTQIAILLRDAGYHDQLDQLVAVLAKYPDIKKLTRNQRAKFLEDLAVQLYVSGLQSHALDVIAKTNEVENGRFFSRAYYTLPYQKYEARVWWDAFAERYPDEDYRRRLTRVDNVMNGKTALKELQPFPDLQPQLSKSSGDGVPMTRLMYGLVEEAQQMVADKQPRQSISIILGRTYLAQEKFGQASAAFYQAWKRNHYDLTRLYLAGHYLDKVGDAKGGNEYRQMALLLAVTMQMHDNIAIGLKDKGVSDDVAQIHARLKRTSPPSHRYYIGSLFHLAKNASDPQQATDWWSEYSLYHLRPTQNYPDLDVWLQSPIWKHTSAALADIERGEFQKAERRWQKAVAINMADVSLPNSIVPALKAKGQNELADRVYKAHESYLKKRAKKYPNSTTVTERLKLLRESCGPKSVGD